MTLLHALLVLGVTARLVLLFVRPSAVVRFRHPRRRLLAGRFEQIGDAVFLVAALCAVVVGGRTTSPVLAIIWTICLVGGLAMVASAHELARRHGQP